MWLDYVITDLYICILLQLPTPLAVDLPGLISWFENREVAQIPTSNTEHVEMFWGYDQALLDFRLRPRPSPPEAEGPETF